MTIPVARGRQRELLVVDSEFYRCAGALFGCFRHRSDYPWESSSRLGKFLEISANFSEGINVPPAQRAKFNNYFTCTKPPSVTKVPSDQRSFPPFSPTVDRVEWTREALAGDADPGPSP